VLAALQQGNAAKAAPAAQPVDRLAQKDKALIAGFVRRGIKRDDSPTADYNVRPFQGWLKLGRQVNKGQHGIRGLFHVSQTSPIAPAKTPKAKAVKGKPQLVA
jgi:hypothetical protein